MIIETKFDFNTKVKDKTTGFSGKVTGCCYDFSNESMIYKVETLKEGNILEHWIEEKRLESIGYNSAM